MFWIVVWDASYDNGHMVFTSEQEAVNYICDAVCYENFAVFQSELVWFKPGDICDEEE